MFTTDRDLLVLEPGLFRDVGWVAQRLTKGTGSISGNTLTITGADVPLDAANITTGHVVTVGGTSYEVIARQSPTALTISRPRASTTDAIQPPSPATGVETLVTTFAPQIAMVERQVLRMAGIEPEDTTPGVVTTSAIVNPTALTMLIALGTLHVLYAAAGASSSANGWLADRAAMYRERFAAARQNARVLIDLDGDGTPDATRKLNVVQFIRA
jgi:hypothetical protein